MRILQVHTGYREPSGEDSVVAAELQMLRDAGHVVTPWHEVNPPDAVGAVRSLALAPHNPFQARKAEGLAASGAHDVAHVHNTWFAMSPAVLRALSDGGLPVVMTLHNYRLVCVNGFLTRDGRPCELCVGTTPFHSVRFGCFRGSRPLSAVAATTLAVNRRLDTYEAVDRFVALSGFARSKAVEGGIAPERIVVIPNFVPDPGPRRASPSASDVVVAVGRVDETKGFHHLVEAWARRPPPGLRLRIVGDGPLRPRLIDMDVPGVELLGRLDRDAVQREMLEARALAFPTLIYENMPMTVLEAWAAGLPVLGSRLGTTVEMIQPFGDRWLVSPGDVDAWAAALQLLEDDRAVDATGSEARARYEADHTAARGLELRERLYRDVTSR